MASKKKAGTKAAPHGASRAAPGTPPTGGSQASAKATAKPPTGQSGSSAPGTAAASVPKALRPRPAPTPEPDPTRPDPDQPPIDGVADRPSVYSEWLNQPAAPPTWLNSPPARTPTATARRRAAAKAAEPPDPMRALLNDQPPPPPPPGAAVLPAPSRPAPRRRTTARRITQAERLSVTGAELRAIVRASADISAAAPPAGTPSAAPATPARAPATGHQRAAVPPIAPPTAAGPPPPRATAPQPTIAGGRATSQPATFTHRTAAPFVSTPPAGRRWPTTADPRVTAAPVGRTGGRAGGSATPPVPPAPQRYATALPATLGQTAERTAVPRTPTGARLPTSRDSGATGVGVGRARADSDSVLIRGARRPPTSTTGPVAPRRRRPAPILAQALVALGTIVFLLAAVTITSPLGYGAAISGTFQAYTSVFAWVPPPTPTATPPPPVYQIPGGQVVSPGTQVVIADIQAVFGPYAQGALNVAHCESGYDPNARNPFAVGNSHAEGVFQILFPSTWDGTSYAGQNPYNYDANIHAAYEIFSRDGHTWREWQCQP